MPNKHLGLRLHFFFLKKATCSYCQTANLCLNQFATNEFCHSAKSSINIKT